MSTTTSLLSLLLLFILVATYQAASNSAMDSAATNGRRPFTVQDLHALKRLSVSDAVLAQTQGENPISLYTLSDWNQETDQKRTSISFVNLTNSQVSTVTKPDWGTHDVSPKLLADGKTILFLSNRAGGELRPYISDLQGRRIIPLPNFSLPDNIGMDNLVLAPNGKYFLFTTGVFVDCDTIQCTSDRLKVQATQDYKLFDQLYIRHWGTWEDGTHSHIFMQSITLNDSTLWSATNDEPRDLMQGVNADSPVKPFGGTEQIAISADSTLVAFTAEQIQHDTAWRTDWDTYITDVTKPTTPHLLTGDRKARTLNPVFSPDGKYLLFGAMDKPGHESDRVHIVQREISTGIENTIAENWDRSVDAIHFDQTGEYLIIEAADDAISKIFSISLKDQSIKELVSSGANHGLMAIRDRKGGVANNVFVYGRSSITAPVDVFTASFDPQAVDMTVQQQTFENKDLLDQVQMMEMEKFYFPCGDPQPDTQGKGCQAWIMKPVGFQDGQKYSVAHLVHGGPEGVWDSSFSYRWNPQLWASRGYVVFMINPHGSSSFGQKFTEAVLGNWGGIPYETLQKGLDALFDNYNYADSKRIGYAGASYGGFMAAYSSTKTDRYKAIVCHDGVFSTEGMGYATEELFFNEAEFGGTPYDNPEGYKKWSPMDSVDKIDKDQKILIIQGGMDFRIPDTQGISYFTALQRRGITSRLLYFPDENHWVLKQKNSIVWYTQVLGWMDKYVKGE